VVLRIVEIAAVQFRRRDYSLKKMHWKREFRLVAKNEWSEIAINLGRPATGGPDIIVQKLKKPSQKPVSIALELDVDGLVHENSEIFRCQLVGVSVEFTESFVIALGANIANDWNCS
jgi:hypothetical protein